jgi:hypothetical protein
MLMQGTYNLPPTNQPGNGIRSNFDRHPANTLIRNDPRSLLSADRLRKASNNGLGHSHAFIEHVQRRHESWEVHHGLGMVAITGIQNG